MSRLVEKYPDDRFELVLRKWLQEWRLKCLDCPGKVRGTRGNVIFLVALTERRGSCIMLGRVNRWRIMKFI